MVVDFIGFEKIELVDRKMVRYMVEFLSGLGISGIWYFWKWYKSENKNKSIV